MKNAGVNEYTPYRLKALRIGSCEHGMLHGVEYLPGEIRTRWAFLGPYSVKVIDEATFEIATVGSGTHVREVWEMSEYSVDNKFVM